MLAACTNPTNIGWRRSFGCFADCIAFAARIANDCGPRGMRRANILLCITRNETKRPRQLIRLNGLKPDACPFLAFSWQKATQDLLGLHCVNGLRWNASMFLRQKTLKKGFFLMVFLFPTWWSFLFVFWWKVSVLQVSINASTRFRSKVFSVEMCYATVLMLRVSESSVVSVCLRLVGLYVRDVREPLGRR